MSVIKCPHCGEEFDISDSNFNQILAQVHSAEFEKEVAKRIEELRKQQEDVLNSEKEKTKASLELQHNKELTKLQNKNNELESQLKMMKSEADIKEESIKSQAKASYIEEISNLKNNIKDLESKIELAGKDKELAVSEAVHKITDEKDKEIKAKEEEVAYYRDLKAKSSTKMVGESLEQHCHDEFDKLRATAFRGDYFEKDNEISESGSKGDFIYRALDSDGTELVSIMFEMKNEMESTEQKHKNEHFFKELDKDRREKNCEYAVLVSMLEADSELYNQGIVDVSHRYNQMYVIRPQFFIPFITMVRNEAVKRADVQRELDNAKIRDVDFSRFSTSLDEFKKNIGVSAGNFRKKYEESMTDIDKAIKALQDTKEAMRLALKHLDTTTNKIDRVDAKDFVIEEKK